MPPRLEGAVCGLKSHALKQKLHKPPEKSRRFFYAALDELVSLRAAYGENFIRNFYH